MIVKRRDIRARISYPPGRLTGDPIVQSVVAVGGPVLALNNRHEPLAPQGILPRGRRFNGFVLLTGERR